MTNPRGIKLRPEELAELRKSIDEHGAQKVANVAGVSQATVANACSGGWGHKLLLEAIITACRKLSKGA